MNNPILLLGLGNTLLKDDGIGVHAIQALKEGYDFRPQIEMIDGGTLGLDLLHLLENRDKILFIDAVDFGKAPGLIGELEDEDISSAFQTKLSVHHIGLPDLLLAAKWMDIKPAKICLIGMQPEQMDMGLEMTESVSGKIGDLVNQIIRKLEGWGITCTCLSS
jgi:hydrogenase maturation protease